MRNGVYPGDRIEQLNEQAVSQLMNEEEYNDFTAAMKNLRQHRALRFAPSADTERASDFA